MRASFRPSVWFVTFALLFAAFGDLALHGRGRDSATSNRSQEQRALFSTRSELVLLNVTVKNRKNQYITGLSKEAFTVFDNGQFQPIRFFLSEDAPVTLGLLIDNSGSMQPNRSLVVAAATGFAETSNPQDDMFALAFNEDVRPALTTESPFTNDPETLREALQRVVTTRGRTALYDAIVRGLEYLDQGSHDRKVLVIVSDGTDNSSSVGFDEVLNRVQASNAVVYTVGLTDPIERNPNRKVLKQLADASGGEEFHPDNVKEVARALQRIATDIRHSYVVAYEPSDAVRDAGIRRVRVTVQKPDDKKLIVRTRSGYLAGAIEARRNGDDHEAAPH